MSISFLCFHASIALVDARSDRYHTAQFASLERLNFLNCQHFVKVFCSSVMDGFVVVFIQKTSAWLKNILQKQQYQVSKLTSDNYLQPVCCNCPMTPKL